MRKAIAFLLLPYTLALAQSLSDYPIRSLSFRNVAVADAFWLPRLDTNASATVPHVLEQCRLTGRIDNFLKAAGLREGHFEGWWFNDSDVYKAIEATAYSLAVHPDPALEALADTIIIAICSAQEADGYLYTPRRTIAPAYVYAKYVGAERWSNLASSHELYDLGHLYEAAVAYHAVTGKRTLLDAAVKNAGLLVNVFGPGKNRSVPGHQEIEIGLVRLYRATGNQEYARLAKFFLDERGRGEGHALYGEYSQDHQPVTGQTEAVGHAVRALYMYAGMTDAAALFGDSLYDHALSLLWDDVVGKKIYLTGGIGAAGRHEGFSGPYELPNLSAYCETCAAIANVLWNERMFRLHGDAQYFDVLERTLYNGLLSGVAFDGRHFFYTNPLESDGRHERTPWFAVACCPPNVARILPQVPGMAYASDDERIYVNLFIAGTATIPFGNDSVVVTQESEYPWEGEVKILVRPPRPDRRFTLAIRVPGWARGEAIPLGLYEYREEVTERPVLHVNGVPWPIDLRKGYAEIQRRWGAEDTVELDLPMPVRRVVSREEVGENAGKVALQRGPLVYCVEGAEGRVINLLLADTQRLDVQRSPGHLPGGYVTVHGVAEGLYSTPDHSVRSEAVEFTALPYYAWAQKGETEMAVWLARSAPAARPVPVPTIASRAKASSSGGDPRALNDQREPKSSSDDANRYLHWWPKKGTVEWTQYDFADATRVSAVEVYWFDDTGKGECRVPKSWQILYRSGDEWKAVERPTGFGVEKDRYNRTEFAPVVTTGIRLVVQLPDSLSSGIHEWRIEE